MVYFRKGALRSVLCKTYYNLTFDNESQREAPTRRVSLDRFIVLVNKVVIRRFILFIPMDLSDTTQHVCPVGISPLRDKSIG